MEGNYKRFKYSEETLKKAISAVENKEMTLSKASISFKIPKSTLFKNISKKVPLSTKKGPPTHLSTAEETMIKDWIIAKARLGFPMRPEDVKDSIQIFVKEKKRETPFINSRPGVKWFSLFLNRHKEIEKRNAEVVSKAKASVTEEGIKNWFSDLKSFLNSEGCSDILEDGSRILNCDKTGMNTFPKSGRLLGPKHMQNFCQVAIGPEKECITVLCCFSANGKSFPPMIVYPYERVPTNIVMALPENWMYGRSDSGQMIASNFFEYIENCLYLWLVEYHVKFPILLLLDGYSSYLSLKLSDFCSKKQIHLYCLPPNATHILQPCNVEIFKPLKSHWNNFVHKYTPNDQDTSSSITKVKFSQIFKKAFDQITTETIIHGFRKCGIFPFNENAVDYDKCIPSRLSSQSKHNTLSSTCNLTNSITKPTPQEFKITKHVIDYIVNNGSFNYNDPIQVIINKCNQEANAK